MRKIHEPNKAKEGYKLKSDIEIHRNLEDLETTISKLRLRFLNHMIRIDPQRLNRKTFR